ncbi:MAG: filamentous hemagglutinin N-terminal domain-containing protein [Oscillatoriales cyanobacterium C42_A2020_001]|nr:filamentous hemagglutinin N-terminal domain-containing protein [Leptolyngbyaceae cyanobacterium C42_A2020_001]
MKSVTSYFRWISLLFSPLVTLASATAQIVPDTTLPTNSNTAPGCTVCTINGGTVRGNHLFHSFREFSIPTGGEAWFNNAPQIQTIFTRVTGSSLSNIDGLIRANGTANLFLLNPNGIVFGANARLQIGGSFVASTANSFQFSDGSEFSATNPQVPPLLTVNIAPGLQYGRPVGDLQQAGNLTVPAGQSLTLFGNTVTHTGALTAPGGIVQVLGDRVALLAPTVIDVSSPTGGGTVRIGGDFRGQGPLPTATATYVGAGTMINADGTAIGANGGAIAVWANNSLKAYGRLSAQSITNNGGLIETSSANTLDVSGIQVEAASASGTSGTWLIDPRNVIIQNTGTTTGTFSGTNPDLFTPTGDDTIISTADIEARLNAGTNVIITTGNTGTQDGNITVLNSITKTVFTPPASLTLEATNDITITPGVSISSLFVPSAFGPLNVTLTADSDRSGTGNVNLLGRIFTNAGSVNISGQSVLLDQAQIESGTPSTLANGASSGAISITANSLTLQNGSRISASDYGTQTSPGINIQLGSSLLLSDNSSIVSIEWGSGTSAPIAINVQNPDSTAILSNSSILTVTNGQGSAGAVSVTAGSISLLGTQSPLVNSSIQSGSNGNGGAGAVSVTATTGSVIANYGAVQSGSRGGGDAGAIAITAADTVSLLNSSIDSRSLGTQGGNLQISARRIVLDDTFVRTSGFGREDSGTMLFQGTESIDVLNDTRISTATFGRGNAGAIQLETSRFRVDNSTITSETYDVGNAGAIAIVADSAAIANNSRILSTVSQGTGTPPTTGNGQVISIDARALTIADSTVSSETFAVGNAGGIVLRTENLTATNSSISTAVNEGAVGRGGNVEVQTRDLTLAEGAQIRASTAGTGRAGDVAVRATGTVNITGESTGIFANTRDTIVNDFTGTAIAPTETGDAGQLLPTAQNLTLQPGTFVTQISGTLDNSNDVDLYQIFLTDGGTFSASTVNGSTIDTQLFLFRSDGTGVYANDDADTGFTLQSTLPANDPLTPRFAGPYYLAISSFNNDPISTGLMFQPGGGTVGTTLEGAFNPLSDWTNSGFGSPGSYTIFLTGTGVAVPNRVLQASGDGGNITVQANTFIVQNNAQLAASTTGQGNAGNVQVTANSFIANTGGQLLTTTSGSGRAGDITVNASNQVQLSNPGTGLFANTSNGPGGTIAVNTNQFQLVDGAALNATTSASNPGGNITVTGNQFAASTGGQILTTTTGAGKAGDITLTFGDRVSLSDPGTGLFANTTGGLGGAIAVNAPTVQVTNGAVLNATTSGISPGGSVSVNAQTFEAASSGQLLTTTFGNGRAGDIIVNANDQVQLSNPGTGLFANTSNGPGGTITVTTNQFQLADGATLNATTAATNPGGSIGITAQTFEAAPGGQLLTTTSGSGKAGDIIVTIGDRLTLSGSGTGLFANTTAGSSGDGGNISATARTVVIQDGAQLAVDSQGSGQGGSVEVQANALTLDRRGVISAETTSNQGGNISLQVSDLLLLRRNSLISTTAGTAQAGGDGGNIQITAPFIIGVLAENSDITANAFSGRGGNINITANAIYGLRSQPRLTPFSDITASSQLGISGTVTLNTLNIDPNRGLIALPSTLVDPSNQVAQTCAPSSKLGRRSNEFIITGRGGVPSNPEENFSGSDRALVTLTELVEQRKGEGVGEWASGRGSETPSTVRLNPFSDLSGTAHVEAHPPTPAPLSPPPSAPLAEAQSWAIAADGTTYLVSNAPASTVHSSWQPSVNCSNF